MAGAPAGDLFLTVHVEPHPLFHRQGNNLQLRVPLTLGEAAAGATVDVPTPKGTVALHVPPGSSSGTKLRVKGHGIAAKSGPGDLIVEVQICCRRTSTPHRGTCWWRSTGSTRRIPAPGCDGKEG